MPKVAVGTRDGRWHETDNVFADPIVWTRMTTTPIVVGDGLWRHGFIPEGKDSMDKQDILDATPGQLNVMVAEQLGWREVKDIGGYPVPTVREYPPYTQSYYGKLPDWSGDIALAWQLDGEGWRWLFDEDDIQVVAEIHKYPYQKIIVASATEPWHKSKAQTYATVRCRVWLLAKLEEPC